MTGLFVSHSNFMLEDAFGDQLLVRPSGGSTVGVRTKGEQGEGPVMVLSREERVRLAQFLVSGTDYEVKERK